jgi:PGF-pre-PGF domain-containing protein
MVDQHALGAVALVLIVIGGVAAGTAVASDGTVPQQGGGDRTPMGPDGGEGTRTPSGPNGGSEGPRTPMGPDGSGDGRANVTVSHPAPGAASVQVRNAASNRTIRIRFERMVESPETGIRLREMTVTGADGAFQVTVRTATRVSAGVNRFPDTPPFGYLTVTHTVSNATVSNASLTFALNRTRLRERNVTDGNVSLYRYRSTDRTWTRLRTRVTERTETAVTYRAESPGLSEFAVASGPAQTDGEPSPTPTVTPPPPTTEGTPIPHATEDTQMAASPPTTERAAPGFGAILSLVALGIVFRRSRSG